MAVTMKDIAILAGVSQQAVSAALSQKSTSRISEEKRLKIIQIAQQLNYVPNDFARKLSGRRGALREDVKLPTHYNVLALVGCSENDFQMMNLIAEGYGYSCIALKFEQEVFRGNPSILLQFPVDGFLFCYSSLQKEQEIILRQHKLPVVTATDWLVGQRWMDVSECDHETGLPLLLKVLKSKGHRRIGFVEFDRNVEYKPYLEKVSHIMQCCCEGDWSSDLLYCQRTMREMYHKYQEDSYVMQGEFAGNYFASLAKPPTAVIMGRCAFYAGLQRSKLNAELAFYGYRNPNDGQFLRVTYDINSSFEWCITKLIDRVKGINNLPEVNSLEPQLFAAKV